GDGGDVEVAAAAAARPAERVAEDADLAGHVGADVHRRVPVALGERAEVAVAVAVPVLGLGERVLPPAAAMEQGHLVIGVEQSLHDVPPDEPRATYDEDPHPSTSRRSTSSPHPTAPAAVRPSNPGPARFASGGRA